MIATFWRYAALAFTISLVLVIGPLPLKEQIWAQQRGLILPEPVDQPAPTNNTNSTSGVSNITGKSELNGNPNITLNEQHKDEQVSKSLSNLTEGGTSQDESLKKQSQQDGGSDKQLQENGDLQPIP